MTPDETPAITAEQARAADIPLYWAAQACKSIVADDRLASLKSLEHNFLLAASALGFTLVRKE